jgi:stage V sporulation protein G
VSCFPVRRIVVEITEVRIKLMDDPQDRLQAFCSITLDSCFVIRDLKIIQGTKGPFVAMPSRKLTDRCPRCHMKNHLRAHYCNQCGAKLDEERATKDDDGRAKLYADIAHPIRSECRDEIQRIVLDSFADEQIRSRDPDYVCRYDDYGEENYARLYEPDDADEPLVQPAAPLVGSAAAQPSRAAAGFPTFRFEPRDAGHPQPPHHLAGQRVDKVHSNGSPSAAQRRDGDEESFGAGIL